MKTHVDYAKRNWRRTIWFFKIFPFWLALIIALNIWDDHSNRREFNWTLIWAGLAFLVFTGCFYVFARFIHKILLRHAEFKDGQSR